MNKKYKLFIYLLGMLFVSPSNASEVVNIPCMIRKYDHKILLSDGMAYDKMLSEHGYKTKKDKYGQMVFLVESRFLKMTRITEEDKLWRVGFCNFELKEK